MSRIADTFVACADAARRARHFRDRRDPTPGDTAAILDALVEGGADVVELGMPFTDPMADGPAIQKANIRSLARAPAPPTCWRSPPPFVSVIPRCRWS